MIQKLTLNFLFYFFTRASATKNKVKSWIFRQELSEDFLNNDQKLLNATLPTVNNADYYLSMKSCSFSYTVTRSIKMNKTSWTYSILNT